MDLTCIRCPMGCAIHVEMENGQVVSVTGNTCPRGAEYAKSEATAPVRTVTSTVRALGGVRPVVAVKTVPDVPKGKIFAVMDAVQSAEVKAPVTSAMFSARTSRIHWPEPRRRRLLDPDAE